MFALRVVFASKQLSVSGCTGRDSAVGYSQASVEVECRLLGSMLGPYDSRFLLNLSFVDAHTGSSVGLRETLRMQIYSNSLVLGTKNGSADNY